MGSLLRTRFEEQWAEFGSSMERLRVFLMNFLMGDEIGEAPASSETGDEEEEEELIEKLEHRYSRTNIDPEEEGELANFAPAVGDLQPIAQIQTGFEGNLTPEQEAALETLRSKVMESDFKDDLLNLPDTPDRFLLRFLRAECSKRRKFNVRKSAERVFETLQWRRDFGIDKLLEDLPEDYEDYRAETAELEAVDKYGRVVVYTHAALLAAHLSFRKYPEDVWKKWIAITVERRMRKLCENSKRIGHEVSAMVIVYDLQGITLSGRRMLPLVRLTHDIGERYYPELLAKLYVVNAPKIASFFFGLVKTFLDPVTASKVQILSGSRPDAKKFLRELHEVIGDQDQIPTQFGGNLFWRYPRAVVEKEARIPPPLISKVQ